MSDDRDNHPRWLLRRADQVPVAGLVIAALTLTAGWWLLHGGPSGCLVEIDRAETLTARFEVDVNTADLPELMQLPGIGPKLARRIIESRDAAGLFTDQADLRRVRGIGPKTLEKLRPFLQPIPDKSSGKRCQEPFIWPLGMWSAFSWQNNTRNGCRGRDAGFPAPPAQIRARIRAYGSSKS